MKNKLSILLSSLTLVIVLSLATANGAFAAPCHVAPSCSKCECRCCKDCSKCCNDCEKCCKKNEGCCDKAVPTAKDKFKCCESCDKSEK